MGRRVTGGNRLRHTSSQRVPRARSLEAEWEEWIKKDVHTNSACETERVRERRENHEEVGFRSCRELTRKDEMQMEPMVESIIALLLEGAAVAQVGGSIFLTAFGIGSSEGSSRPRR